MSISNTRLSSRAQLMRAEGEWVTGFKSSAVSLMVTGPPGVTSARSLALGASTPWKRIRLSLGRGTSAARRCMNSNGAIPVRAFQLQYDITGAVEFEPFVGDGGACK